MQRTAEQQKQATELFACYKAEIDKRELSNTDNYDKNILMLSSAGLAISLTLIKDIMPIGYASCLFLLYFAWGCFGLSISSTIASFLISNKALQCQLEIAEQYYIYANEDAFSKANVWTTATKWLNRMSGLLFVLAIISVIIFGIINFSKKNTMSENKKAGQEKINVALGGQHVPSMQQVFQVNGAETPKMQAIPTQQADSKALSSDNPTSADQKTGK